MFDAKRLVGVCDSSYLNGKTLRCLQTVPEMGSQRSWHRSVGAGTLSNDIQSLGVLAFGGNGYNV